MLIIIYENIIFSLRDASVDDSRRRRTLYEFIGKADCSIRNCLSGTTSRVGGDRMLGVSKFLHHLNTAPSIRFVGRQEEKLGVEHYRGRQRV